MRANTMRIAVAGLAVVAVLMLAAGGAGAADPANYARLCPATYEFFAFVDVANIRNSKLWAELKPTVLDQKAMAGLAGIEQFFGLRLPDDIDVVAVSGKIGQNNQTVLLLEGKLDRQRLEGFARMNPTFQEMVKPAGKILAFMDQNKGTMTYGSFLTDRLLAVGPDATAVETALNAHAGQKAATLADNPIVKTYLSEKLTSAMAVAVAFPPATLPPQANNIPSIRNLRSAYAAITDGPAALTGIVRLEADTPQMAAKWNDIARGVVALGQIQTQIPKAAEIANQASATLRGNVVEVAAQVKTADISELAKQRIAEGRKLRPNLGGGGGPGRAGQRQGVAPGAQLAPERPLSPQW